MGYLTKRRTYEILEAAKEGDTASKIAETFIMTIITLKVMLVKALQGSSRMDAYCPHCGERIENPQPRGLDGGERRSSP